ncbi:MAG: hypothetical protein IJ230_01505, partial [Clostridia bacterium]|nr:hypothetical protein [Clostridia bacterium]
MVDIMKEYDIPTKYFDKEAAESMCTVSNGIYSWGEEKGKQDEQRHTIQILLDLGQSVEQIIHEFHYPETLVHEVVKEQLA